MITQFAKWWLIDGNKYTYSKWRSGGYWSIDAETALNSIGLSLSSCNDMHDVVRLLYGKMFWKKDAFYQLDDRVLPPMEFVMNRGDDCDGNAMMHAQCMEYVLKKKGWKSQIVSYLAEPFSLSHHYCVLTEPNGTVWVVQPQPTEEGWNKYGTSCQVVFGPYKSIAETVPVVAGWYGAKVVFYDLRDSKFEKVS